MKHLFKYIKRYWYLIIILVIFTYLQVTATLKLPNYMADIVDNGIIGQDMSAIYHSGLLMIAVTFGAIAASIVVSFLASRIATGFTRDVRLALFVKIERFSINEFDKFSTASLITRSTNDMQQIQQALVMMLRMMLMAPIMAVGALQNALEMAPEMSWIITLAVAIILTVIATVFAIGLPKFKLLQKMIDKLNLVTRENLTGLRVVRAFNNEKREQAKFEAANLELTRLNLFTNRLMVAMQPIMTLVMSLSTVAIVWFGAHLVFDETIQIGSMLAFMQYTIQVIMSFLMLSMMFIIIPRAAVSARRVGDVLATESSVVEPDNPKKLPAKSTGSIEFRNVTFSYPDADQPVISDISFTAESGQTTAIIGSTGSGKSTLINLIPRFYDAVAGQVLLDGIDIRDLSLSDLRSQIGFVPQKSALFSGTIASNISYGHPDLNQESMQNVTETAQASSFINKLNDGYEHEVSQGGANLSGGQKQRLSIARALAVDPSIYVFDDSFSALDFKTDAKLRKALAKKTKGKTTLIVAQRISSISDADKIIVISDDGKIVGQGNHKTLLETNSIYQEIAASQLSDEELSSIENQQTSRKKLA